jgi:hypothetical protein
MHGVVKAYVEHYNNVRLNSAIGHITPKDLLARHQQEIQAKRDRKLEAAREQEESPPAGRVTNETDYYRTGHDLRTGQFGGHRRAGVSP